MQDLLRRPLVPLEMTEENKKAALVNELLMDKNNFIYIKRADGTFPSIQEIILEYMGGSMVFKGFVDTKADLNNIDLDSSRIGDMWIVREDESYEDPEDNKNIEYIVAEDTNKETGEKFRYWECLGNPFVRGIDEEYPIYGSTKLITSNAVFSYANKHFISNIRSNDDDDSITFTIGYENSEDETIKTKEVTIGADRHRKVETRADQNQTKYLTGTPNSGTSNDVLLYDKGVYVTAGSTLHAVTMLSNTVVVSDNNDSEASRTVISPSAMTTNSGVAVIHEGIFKAGPVNYKGSKTYGLILNNGGLTSYASNVNLNFDGLYAMGSTGSMAVLTATTMYFRDENFSNTNKINFQFGTLNLGKNLYLESTNMDKWGIDKIYNTSADLNINFENQYGVKLGSSNVNSIARGSWTLGNQYDNNAETIVKGVLTVDGGNMNKISNIYNALKIENNKGVSLFYSTPVQKTLLAQFTRDNHSDFYSQVDIGKDKSIRFHVEDDNSDSDNDTILSLGNAKLVDPTSADGSLYTEYKYNKIFSTADTFNIEGKAILIGNSITAPIKLGYVDNSNSALAANGKIAPIELNGRVTLRTSSADNTDIADLHAFLMSLKKDWSEGLQSINSALTLMGGGLVNFSETTSASEIIQAIKDFRATAIQSSEDSGIIYSTINGSDYRRGITTISGNTTGEINAQLKYFANPKDTTYTIETKKILSTKWVGKDLKWSNSDNGRSGVLTSISLYDGDNPLVPDKLGTTAKTVIPAGRYYFEEDVTLKSIQMTVPTYLTKDTEGAGSVEGKYGSWISEKDTDSIPYISIKIDPGYYDVEPNLKLTDPVIRFNAASIDITKKPLLFGDTSADKVLKGETFSSSVAGRKAVGTMPNNGSVSKKLDAGEKYVIAKGYHDGTGVITSTGMSSQTEGTAVISDILIDKTAWVNGEKITGTMPDNGSVSKTLNAGDSYTIAKGYHDGTGVILSKDLASQTEGTAIADNLLIDKTAWVNGVKITGAMPDNTGYSRIVESLEATLPTVVEIPKGYHNGTTKVVVYPLSSHTKGTADADSILDGKTAWVDGYKITGTIPINDVINAEDMLCGGIVPIPKGYYAEDGYVKAATLFSQTPGSAIADNILINKTAWVNGEKITGAMPDNTGYNETVGSLAGSSATTITIPKGYHDGTTKVTIYPLVMYTQATADDFDILSGKTAWVTGYKKTGSRKNFTAELTSANCKVSRVRHTDRHDIVPEVQLAAIYAKFLKPTGGGTGKGKWDVHGGLKAKYVKMYNGVANADCTVVIKDKGIKMHGAYINDVANLSGYSVGDTYVPCFVFLVSIDKPSGWAGSVTFGCTYGLLDNITGTDYTITDDLTEDLASYKEYTFGNTTSDSNVYGKTYSNYTGNYDSRVTTGVDIMKIYVPIIYGANADASGHVQSRAKGSVRVGHSSYSGDDSTVFYNTIMHTTADTYFYPWVRIYCSERNSYNEGLAVNILDVSVGYIEDES